MSIKLHTRSNLFNEQQERVEVYVCSLKVSFIARAEEKRIVSTFELSCWGSYNGRRKNGRQRRDPKGFHQTLITFNTLLHVNVNIHFSDLLTVSQSFTGYLAIQRSLPPN